MPKLQEEWQGYKTVVADTVDNCVKCAFDIGYEQCRRTACYHTERADKQDVHFVKETQDA